MEDNRSCLNFSKKLFGFQSFLVLGPLCATVQVTCANFQFSFGYVLVSDQYGCLSFTPCDESGAQQSWLALPKVAAGLCHCGFSLPAASAPLLWIQMQEAQNSWKELWNMAQFTSSHYRDRPAGHGNIQNQVACAQGVKVGGGQGGEKSLWPEQKISSTSINPVSNGFPPRAVVGSLG